MLKSGEVRARNNTSLQCGQQHLLVSKQPRFTVRKTSSQGDSQTVGQSGSGRLATTATMAVQPKNKGACQRRGRAVVGVWRIAPTIPSPNLFRSCSFHESERLSETHILTRNWCDWARKREGALRAQKQATVNWEPRNGPNYLFFFQQNKKEISWFTHFCASKELHNYLCWSQVEHVNNYRIVHRLSPFYLYFFLLCCDSHKVSQVVVEFRTCEQQVRTPALLIYPKLHLHSAEPDSYENPICWTHNGFFLPQKQMKQMIQNNYFCQAGVWWWKGIDA